MDAAWSSGLRLIDVVIVITLLEAVLLAAHHRVTGRGVAPREFVPNLVSGLALMLALRAGLDGGGGAWLAAALLVSGIAHVVDLRRRWTGWR